MRTRVCFLLFLCLGSLVASSSQKESPSSKIKKIILICMENHSYDNMVRFFYSRSVWASRSRRAPERFEAAKHNRSRNERVFVAELIARACVMLALLCASRYIFFFILEFLFLSLRVLVLSKALGKLVIKYLSSSIS